MPGYVFANKDQRGTTTVTYTKEQRGNKWWYKREVIMTIPGATDEYHFQWFGGYDSEADCAMKIANAKIMDREFAEL